MQNTILRIDSSLFGPQGQSSQLAEHLVTQLNKTSTTTINLKTAVKPAN